MDRIYYIAENESLHGPFTIEELRDHGIMADSRIYARGWTDFRNASEVPELAELLHPFNNRYVSQKEESHKEESNADIIFLIGKVRELETSVNRLNVENEALKAENDRLNSEIATLRNISDQGVQPPAINTVEAPMWEQPKDDYVYTPAMARNERILNEIVAFVITLPIVLILWFLYYSIGSEFTTGRKAMAVGLAVALLIGFVINRRIMQDSKRKIKCKLKRGGY